VVLITFTSPELLLGYHDHNELPFDLVRDSSRASYRAYGLGRGSASRVWGLRAARRYVDIIRRDGFGALRRPVEDTLQLGGDFVIAPDGTLAWGFWSEGPDERPSVEALVRAVATSVGD
jgi:hypothetical protein